MHKRRRRAEMAAPTIVMLVSHDITIQGGGLPWFTFFYLCPPLRDMVANVRDIQALICYATIIIAMFYFASADFL